jgi:CxxC motif-containing protein (DUF1111 family)
MNIVPLVGACTVAGLAAFALNVAANPERGAAQANTQANALANPWKTMPAQTAPPFNEPPPASGAVDPGVRGGAPGAGGPLPDIDRLQTPIFNDGLVKFQEAEDVAGGLGPRFNSNSCVSCHSHPAAGGSSPAQNPLLQVAIADGARNAIPWFITSNGPVREARFKRHADGTPDGNVHALFTISGRRDARGCTIAQFNFGSAGNPLTGLGGNPNLAFRIPTPLFGSGLIEAIPDGVILANMAAQTAQKSQMGIRGRANSIMSGNVNLGPNDGTIMRLGWKAQNKSLLLFSAEAYNVEQGVTNEIFTDERDQTPGCLLNATPEDRTRYEATVPNEVFADIVAFSNFMRLLAPPMPAPDTPSIVRGRATFSSVGCAVCHTPSLTTGSLIPDISAARPNQKVNLYSDLLIHNMGTALADGITQGAAGPDEFRTAPLWGLGKRVFFLHDGRTRNLVDAITYHRSPGSEANQVVDRYYRLSPQEQQDMLNFLRAL